MRHWVLTIALIVTLAVCPALAQRRGIEGSFDRTLNASGNIDLEVWTGAGSIDIRPGSGNRVEIHGRVRASSDWFRSSGASEQDVRDIEANPPIEQSGNTIRIGRTNDRRDRDLYRNVSISYEIIVPAQTSVRSHSGSGSIAVSGMRGAVSAETGSGSVRIAQAGSGDVELSSGSGSIEATGVSGALRASTGSGRIEVEGEQRGRWNLHTGSGSVNIRLPRQAAFDLNAHTGSGGIHVDHPVTVQGRIESHRHDVTGRVRGGGYALDVSTGSGSIRIE